jgi:hypothetical protein
MQEHSFHSCFVRASPRHRYVYRLWKQPRTTITGYDAVDVDCTQYASGAYRGFGTCGERDAYQSHV